MELILLFLLFTLILFYSGGKLSIYGEELGKRFGLGKTVVGIALIASITSLPELFTGSSAILLLDAPDIALGDIYGSCMVNLVILSIVNTLFKNKLWAYTDNAHVITGIVSILLISTTLFYILSEFEVSLYHISLLSLILIPAYLFLLGIVFSYEKVAEKEELYEEKIPTSVLLFKYLMSAFVVLLSGVSIAILAEEISKRFNLTESFVGTFFVSISTSLPELFVSLSALKYGLIHISVSNILGSNIFNVSMVSVYDFLFTKGSIYAEIDKGVILTLISVIIMTSAVCIGIIYKDILKNLKVLYFLNFFIIFIYLLTILSFN